MHWGKRRYHRESYFTRQHAKYERRLKKRLIPGYGRHRKYDFKQWRNRVHQRYYRAHTYPSFSERFRMKMEGYNPHPRRRSRTYTYRTVRRPRKAVRHVRRERKPKRLAKTPDGSSPYDDPLSSCLGCGCLSFFAALLLGIVSGSALGFVVILSILLIVSWALYRDEKKHPEEYHQKRSRHDQQSPTGPGSSSQSASSDDYSSRKDARSAYRSRSTQSELVASSANAVVDSVQSVMDAVVSQSDQGRGFDTARIQHSIKQAESSMMSLYPQGHPQRSFVMSNLSDMYSDATKAGLDFNHPSEAAKAMGNVTINISVHGLSDRSQSASNSASHSSSSAD